MSGEEKLTFEGLVAEFGPNMKKAWQEYTGGRCFGLISIFEYMLSKQSDCVKDLGKEIYYTKLQRLVNTFPNEEFNTLPDIKYSSSLLMKALNGTKDTRIIRMVLARTSDTGISLKHAEMVKGQFYAVLTALWHQHDPEIIKYLIEHTTSIEALEKVIDDLTGELRQYSPEWKENTGSDPNPWYSLDDTKKLLHIAKKQRKWLPVSNFFSSVTHFFSSSTTRSTPRPTSATDLKERGNTTTTGYKQNGSSVKLEQTVHSRSIVTSTK